MTTINDLYAMISNQNQLQVQVHDNNIISPLPLTFNPLKINSDIIKIKNEMDYVLPVDALVILNSSDLKINPLNMLFFRLWSQATIHVCADGGANRLYDSFDDEKLRMKFIPTYINGDFDSIRPEVKEFYRSLGSKLIHEGNQDTNDLEKTLQLLHDIQFSMYLQGSNQLKVIIYGALGGRFDQEMQNFNTLYKWQCFSKIILLSNESLAFLLPPGYHSIHPNFEIESRTCGLIPLGCKCNDITTHGLKWNLSGEEMCFGGLISSSNYILSSSIFIQNSDPLIWTTTLRHHQK